MATWVWIVIAVVVVLVVLGVIWTGLRARRSKGLQERFGSEYDRVAADAPTKRAAESELREREERREQFDIRPLEPEERKAYRAQWQTIQARFVDDPAGSLAAADSLIQTVMRERGYPVDDFDTRAGDLSVDHPERRRELPRRARHRRRARSRQGGHGGAPQGRAALPRALRRARGARERTSANVAS